MSRAPDCGRAEQNVDEISRLQEDEYGLTLPVKALVFCFVVRLSHRCTLSES